jgi:hypothetical protein
MTHEQAVTELKRQLATGESTPTQYQQVIDRMESEMVVMHTEASYDVLRYMQCEATANAYREAIAMPKSDITEKSAVSPALTNGEYRTAIATQLPQPKPRRHSGTRYEENCSICGKYSFEICNTCGGCPRCCTGA